MFVFPSCGGEGGNRRVIFLLLGHYFAFGGPRKRCYSFLWLPQTAVGVGVAAVAHVIDGVSERERERHAASRSGHAWRPAARGRKFSSNSSFVVVGLSCRESLAGKGLTEGSVRTQRLC